MSVGKAELLFVALYLAGVFAVCELNDTYIIRDAVVGPVLVAAMYVVFLSPSALVGGLVLARRKMAPLARLRLAIAFPILIGAFVEAVFIASQWSVLKPFVMANGVLIFVAGNIVLALVFVAVAWWAKSRSEAVAA